MARQGSWNRSLVPKAWFDGAPEGWFAPDLLPTPAAGGGPLVFSNLNVVNQTTSNPIVSGSVTVPNGAMCLVAYNSAQTAPNVAGTAAVTSAPSGLTFVQVGRAFFNPRMVVVFAAVNTSGSDITGTISVTYTPDSGGTLTGHDLIVDLVTGVDTTTPYDAAVTNSVSTATITSPDVGTPGTGDGVYAAAFTSNPASDLAVDSPLTALARATGANTRQLATGYDLNTTPDETPSATSGTSAAMGIVAFIVNVSAGGGGGSQTATQTSRFDNSQTFYAGTLKQRINQGTRFDNAQTFYAGTASNAAGSQTATQTSRFDNAQTFYAGSVRLRANQSTRFDNAQTFYAGKVNTRPSQNTRFNNSQTFYAGQANLRLTQGTRFNNSQTFYAGALRLRINQGTRFDNAQTFYGGSASNASGPQTATQTARFNNAQTFYAGTISIAGALPLTHGGGVSYTKPRREKPLKPWQPIPWDDVFVDEYVVERAEATLEAAAEAAPRDYDTSWADTVTHAIGELRGALALAAATQAKQRIARVIDELEELRRQKAEEVSTLRKIAQQQKEDDEAILRLFTAMMRTPAGIVEKHDD